MARACILAAAAVREPCSRREAFGAARCVVGGKCCRKARASPSAWISAARPVCWAHACMHACIHKEARTQKSHSQTNTQTPVLCFQQANKSGGIVFARARCSHISLFLPHLALTLVPFCTRPLAPRCAIQIVRGEDEDHESPTYPEHGFRGGHRSGMGCLGNELAPSRF